MAKEQPKKDGEVRLKEKKISDDKITKKDKKEKRVKKEVNLEAELEHRPKPTKKDTGAEAEEDEAVNQAADEIKENPFAKKEEKKRRKKEKKLHDMVLDRLMEQEIGPSPTAAGKHVEVESERKKAKKAARKAEKKAEKLLLKAAQEAEAAAKTSAPGPVEESTEDAPQATVDPSGLFMIDTNPTKVSWPKANPTENAAADNTEGDQPHMNRAARRRLELIAVQNGKIQEKLGVEVGSTEPNAEVDTELAMWIAKTDEQAAERAQKKKSRKEQEARRLEKRKGRLIKVIKDKGAAGGER